MKILLIDFETQGLDHLNDPPTEVGAVLYDTETDTFEEYEKLIYDKSYKPQPKEIVEITGITDEDLQKNGVHPMEVFLHVLDLYRRADCIVAYSLPFDKLVFERAVVKLGLNFEAREWVDALHDVPYPAKFRCRKLSHLALDHRIPMDGYSTHRALDDVLIMLELIRKYFPFENILENKRKPSVVIRAVVPHPKADGGRGKDAAKAAGFRWQDPGDPTGRVFELCWVKIVKEDQIDAERARLPDYPIIILK